MLQPHAVQNCRWMASNWSIPLFRVFGIRLEMHLSFLLLLAYFGWTGYSLAGFSSAAYNILLILLIFSCVVLHELGHSLTARVFGVSTQRILLLPIGGMAQLGSMPRSPWKELLITVAGPAVNFALAAVLYLTFRAAINFNQILSQPALLLIHHTFQSTIVGLMVFNLIMGLFNLIPVFPMDGGRLLRSTLAFFLSYERATEIAAWVAKPLAIAGIIGALVFGPNYLLAILFAFIFFAGSAEAAHVKSEARLRDIAVGELVSRNFKSFSPESSLGSLLEILCISSPEEFVITKPGEERPLGVVTQEELLNFAKRYPLGKPIGDLLTRPPSLVQSHWPAEILGQQALRRRSGRTLVMSGDILVGVVRWDTINPRLDAIHLRRKHLNLTPSGAHSEAT